MWELDCEESWVRKIDAFELWCWRRLLRVPCTTRRSNQSILKEISPEYSLEGLILKLKLWYSGHLMQRVNLLEKMLMLGKTEGRRRRDWQRIRWLDGIIDLMDMSLSKLWETVKDRVAWRAVVYECAKSPTQPSDWRTTQLPGCSANLSQSYIQSKGSLYSDLHYAPPVPIYLPTSQTLKYKCCFSIKKTMMERKNGLVPKYSWRSVWGTCISLLYQTTFIYPFINKMSHSWLQKHFLLMQKSFCSHFQYIYIG